MTRRHSLTDSAELQSQMCQPSALQGPCPPGTLSSPGRQPAVRVHSSPRVCMGTVCRDRPHHSHLHCPALSATRISCRRMAGRQVPWSHFSFKNGARGRSATRGRGLGLLQPPGETGRARPCLLAGGAERGVHLRHAQEGVFADSVVVPPTTASPWRSAPARCDAASLALLETVSQLLTLDPPVSLDADPASCFTEKTEAKNGTASLPPSEPPA